MEFLNATICTSSEMNQQQDIIISPGFGSLCLLLRKSCSLLPLKPKVLGMLGTFLDLGEPKM